MSGLQGATSGAYYGPEGEDSNRVTLTLIEPTANPDAYNTPGPPKNMGNAVELGGWDSVEIVRSCERVPSAFQISATEKWPGHFEQVWIEPGAYCQVKAGTDVLITGYVDAVSREITADRHVVHVTGRSLVEDIVDCSVYQPRDGMTVQSASLSDLATKICKAYGIQVRALTEGFYFGQQGTSALTFHGQPRRDRFRGAGARGALCRGHCCTTMSKAGW